MNRKAIESPGWVLGALVATYIVYQMVGNLIRDHMGSPQGVAGVAIWIGFLCGWGASRG